MIKLKNEHKIAIIAIIIILLLLFLFWDTGEEVGPTQTVPVSEDTVSCSVSGSKAKLMEGANGYTQDINWAECCAGFITVTMDYSWDFFATEDATECDNGHPITFIVTDSAGNEVFESEEYVPGSSTETFRGYWDCMTSWDIFVNNECQCSDEGTFPSISYEWDMTMVCD